MTYLWPKTGGGKHKARVVLALALLVGGKVLNIQVPFFFKEIVNKLNVTADSTEEVLLAVPLALIVGCECHARPARTLGDTPHVPILHRWLSAGVCCRHARAA